MWYPPDPDEPTSELYRLMPPRRPGDDDPVVLISPDPPRWRALDAVTGHTSRALRPVDHPRLYQGGGAH